MIITRVHQNTAQSPMRRRRQIRCSISTYRKTIIALLLSTCWWILALYIHCNINSAICHYIDLLDSYICLSTSLLLLSYFIVLLQLSRQFF